MAVGVHGVAGAEDAGQGAGDCRVGEEVGQLGDCGQDAVTGIALGREDFFGLGVDRLVKGAGEIGFHGHVAVDDELLHMRIVKKLHSHDS